MNRVRAKAWGLLAVVCALLATQDTVAGSMGKSRMATRLRPWVAGLLLAVPHPERVPHELRPEPARVEAARPERRLDPRIPLDSVRPKAGERLVLKSGATYEGTLRIEQDSVTIEGEKGARPATIRARQGSVIEIRGASEVTVRNLRILGQGAHGNGVRLTASDPSRRPKGVHLKGLEISGFEGDHFAGARDGNGILIETEGKGLGYSGVVIEDTKVFANSHAGLLTESSSGSRHEDVRISRVEAFRNPGVPTSQQHSGSGILLGGVSRAVVEDSMAYENGALNLREGGPVGIWAWDANDVIIRRNKSFRNRTASKADGGGFDLDGSVTRAIIEDNESWGNDGPGYLLCTFEGSEPVRNVIIRRNKSRDDGRKNGYGAFTVWGDIRDAVIEDNDFEVSASSHGIAKAISFQNWTGSNIRIRRNRIRADAGTELLSFQQVEPSSLATVELRDNTVQGDLEARVLRQDQQIGPLGEWQRE